MHSENGLFYVLMGSNLLLSTGILVYAHAISPPYREASLDLDRVISILEIDLEDSEESLSDQVESIEDDVNTAIYSEKFTESAAFTDSVIIETAHLLNSTSVSSALSHSDYSPPARNKGLYQLDSEHQDYEVSKFIETAKDAHSTFSVDVDTASFTLARSRLNSGGIPSKTLVRTEEFINYFKYGYAPPSNGDVFNVDMKTFMDPIRKDRSYLRVALKGKEFSKKTRPALNLSFLVDVSGSMSMRNKLPLAKKSMRRLVESLRPDDTISISTYAGRTALILPATSGRDKDLILDAIETMKSGGSTAMSSGITLAYEQVWKHFDSKKENRVIILSDGDANVGSRSPTELLEQISSYADRGVTLSTIGFGMGNYNDRLMEQLANKGDGNNYYIDTPEQANRTFGKEFNSTLISIARDVKIQVEFDPKVVSSYRLIGYENRAIIDEDFRNDYVDAGEVGAGHSVTALYELKTTGYKGTLATTRLRYEAPGKNGKATERVYHLPRQRLSSPTQDLKLVYAAATFAEILKDSPYVHDISLERLSIFVQKSNLSSELHEMIQQARENTFSASK